MFVKPFSALSELAASLMANCLNKIPDLCHLIAEPGNIKTNTGLQQRVLKPQLFLELNKEINKEIL